MAVKQNQFGKARTEWHSRPKATEKKQPTPPLALFCFSPFRRFRLFSFPSPTQTIFSSSSFILSFSASLFSLSLLSLSLSSSVSALLSVFRDAAQPPSSISAMPPPVHETTETSRYLKRLGHNWPRLVVALVSLYGAYYALNIIQSTSQEIKALSFSPPPCTDPCVLILVCLLARFSRYPYF